MKLGLDIKNPRKAIRPSKDDIIIYDGKQWYVTTKEDLFKEFEERISTKEKELDDKIEEMNEFKVKSAKQIATIAQIVEDFIKEDK